MKKSFGNPTSFCCWALYLYRYAIQENVDHLLDSSAPWAGLLFSRFWLSNKFLVMFKNSSYFLFWLWLCSNFKLKESLYHCQSNDVALKIQHINTEESVLFIVKGTIQVSAWRCFDVHLTSKKGFESMLK